MTQIKKVRSLLLNPICDEFAKGIEQSFQKVFPGPYSVSVLSIDNLQWKAMFSTFREITLCIEYNVEELSSPVVYIVDDPLVKHLIRVSCPNTSGNELDLLEENLTKIFGIAFETHFDFKLNPIQFTSSIRDVENLKIGDVVVSILLSVKYFGGESSFFVVMPYTTAEMISCIDAKNV